MESEPSRRLPTATGLRSFHPANVDVDVDVDTGAAASVANPAALRYAPAAPPGELVGSHGSEAARAASPQIFSAIRASHDQSRP